MDDQPKPENMQQIQVNTTDEISRGRYSNGMLVNLRFQWYLFHLFSLSSRFDECQQIGIYDVGLRRDHAVGIVLIRLQCGFF